LQERHDLLQKKATLQLFVNVSESIKKIEKLLNIETTGSSSNTLVLDKYTEESSNLIERIASEFNQLKFYVSKGKHLLFVKNMEPVCIYNIEYV
jgi:hypothetical protein